MPEPALARTKLELLPAQSSAWCAGGHLRPLNHGATPAGGTLKAFREQLLNRLASDPADNEAQAAVAERLATRIELASAEPRAGSSPLGLLFPSPAGQLLRSSNSSRRVLKHAYLTAGWRDAGGYGPWTWRSLRHVFSITALSTWSLDPTDVACLAGHTNVQTTLQMYVGSAAGILDRARAATE
jgi:integrase